MKYLICIGVSLITLQAQAEDRIGKIYEMDRTNEAPLFIQKIHREDTPSGQKISESTITNAKGEVILHERAVMAGAKIISQQLEQFQINEAYELETHEDIAIFRTFDLSHGKKEKKSESKVKVDASFITGPVSEFYLKNHGPELVDGKKVSAEFGIFEFEKPVSFEYSTRKSGNGSQLFLQMRPASFWLSLLVDPIYIDLDAKSFKMIKYKGRTPVKQYVHGKWKSINAEIIYTDI